jgi:hypothetical protein
VESAMTDLYDLTIAHWDAELGVDDCDFWEDITHEEAMKHIHWHLDNVKVTMIAFDAVEARDAPKPSFTIFPEALKAGAFDGLTLKVALTNQPPHMDVVEVVWPDDPKKAD